MKNILVVVAYATLSRYTLDMPKVSESAKQILKLFTSTCSPLSSLDIQKRLPKLDRATIYRSLKNLKEDGLIQIIDLGDGVTHYEGNLLHHHHIVCLKCKKIVPVEISPEVEEGLAVFQKNIHKEFHFQNLAHTLEFFGICSQCQ